MASVTDGVLRQAKIVKADVDFLEKQNAQVLRQVRAVQCFCLKRRSMLATPTALTAQVLCDLAKRLKLS